MKTTRLDEIKARCASRTPGRWRFCVVPEVHSAVLMADVAGEAPTRTVLDFTRWGSNHASGRFYQGAEPQRLDKLLVQGRVVHADAAFIEHAPEDIDFLLGEVDRLSRQADGRLRLVLRLRGWSPEDTLRRFWRRA